MVDAVVFYIWKGLCSHNRDHTTHILQVDMFFDNFIYNLLFYLVAISFLYHHGHQSYCTSSDPFFFFDFLSQ